MNSTQHGANRVSRARLRVGVEGRTAPRYGRVRIDRCRLHPANQREHGDLRALGTSIDTEGLEQPITVQEHDGWYEVVDGARRFLAAKLHANRKTIDAFIRPPRPVDEVLAASIGTDVHKLRMTPVERGRKVLQLRDEHGWGVADLAAYWGVAESTVYGWMAQARADESPDETPATAPGADEHATAAAASNQPGPPPPPATRVACRRSGRGRPKWKARLDELCRRWEVQLGEHGLDREQAEALIAELADLAGANQPAVA